MEREAAEFAVTTCKGTTSFGRLILHNGLKFHLESMVGWWNNELHNVGMYSDTVICIRLSAGIMVEYTHSGLCYALNDIFSQGTT